MGLTDPSHTHELIFDGLLRMLLYEFVNEKALNNHVCTLFMV